MNTISGFDGEYRFLSNFYPSVIQVRGITYPTVEHAYQAMKTTDHAERERIAKLDTPGKAKRSGKKLVLREDWEAIKIDEMESLVQIKFQDKELALKLIETGKAYLVETNTWGDRFWGVCKGVGQNQLGLLLMRVREQVVERRERETRAKAKQKLESTLHYLMGGM